MERDSPGQDTARTVVALATPKASSLAWTTTGHTIALRTTQPLRRCQLLDAGRAVHHLRVAVATLGLTTEIHWLPDSADQNLLATAQLSPAVHEVPPTAVSHRSRTAHHRPPPLSERETALLTRSAEAEHCALAFVRDGSAPGENTVAVLTADRDTTGSWLRAGAAASAVLSAAEALGLRAQLVEDAAEPPSGRPPRVAVLIGAPLPGPWHYGIGLPVPPEFQPAR